MLYTVRRQHLVPPDTTTAVEPGWFAVEPIYVGTLPIGVGNTGETFRRWPCSQQSSNIQAGRQLRL